VKEHLSAGAATKLINQYGFRKVFALEGGFREWKDQKLPLASGSEGIPTRP
jgi:3-mercaptopyruvate sulfurtransferase SseA